MAVLEFDSKLSRCCHEYQKHSFWKTQHCRYFSSSTVASCKVSTPILQWYVRVSALLCCVRSLCCVAEQCGRWSICVCCCRWLFTVVGLLRCRNRRLFVRASQQHGLNKCVEADQEWVDWSRIWFAAHHLGSSSAWMVKVFILGDIFMYYSQQYPCRHLNGVLISMSHF